MRVLVCGGRDYTDYTKVCKVLGAVWADCLDSLTIIEGGARGADGLARLWATSNRLIKVETFPAEWETYGKSAGFIRNSKMLKEGKPDLVVAFPGGKGTAMMVKIAKDAGVKVIEVDA